MKLTAAEQQELEEFMGTRIIGKSSRMLRMKLVGIISSTD